jgi:hypothetical protein
MSEPSTAFLGTFGRLPLELRNMVYDEIFARAEVITPIRGVRAARAALSGDQLLQPAAYNKPPVHTCILATNKTIHEEARDVLYRDRIVRGSITQLTRLLRNTNFRDCVRRIEIDDYLQSFLHHHSAQALLLQLRDLAQHPSTTILSDKFAFTQHSGTSWVGVRDFVILMHLGEATCVDIGRFQLSGKFNHIQIVHHKLVKMWPDVVGTPEDYDIYTDVLGLLNTDLGSLCSDHDMVAWAAQTSLRRWVGLCNKGLIGNGNLDPFLQGRSREQRLLLVRFLSSIRPIGLLRFNHWQPECFEHVYERRLGRKLLNALTPEDDPETLAWVTDLLSINIAAYFPMRGRRQLDSLRPTHRAEVDGGMHTLDIMKTHMVSALSGDLNDCYVSHPLFTRRLEKTYVVQSRLAWFPRQILKCEAHALNPRQTRQFYLLHLAADYVQHHEDQHHQQLVDEWSLHLFRRYLLADPTVYEDEARCATLEAMRDLWRTIVPHFGSADQEFRHVCTRLRRNTEPPRDLDADLVPILAWEYGRLFVHAWRFVARDRGLVVDNSEIEGSLNNVPSAPP